LREEFFNRLKYETTWYWNNEKQKEEGYVFYNINDPKFWDSCILWQKDVSIPGCYQFQLTGNVKPGDQRAILDFPLIHYPDSLLKLYYENR